MSDHSKPPPDPAAASDAPAADNFGIPADPGPDPGSDPAGAGEVDRRGFLGRLGTVAMAGGLVAGYGTFGAMAARYLYPARPRASEWLFLAVAAELRPGDSLPYRAPDGNTVVVARQGVTGTITDFIALSSTCPHLGCKVQWEAHNRRFFCPCHNGVFDPTGKAVAGPPAEARQSLARYPLKIERGMLFIQAPLERLAGGNDAIARAPGTPDVRVARLCRRDHRRIRTEGTEGEG